MAKKASNLDTRVEQLLGRGKSDAEVIRSIKQSKTGRSINDRYIKQAIARAKASTASSTKIGSLKPNQPISKSLGTNNQGSGRTVRVAYTFQFDFSAGGSRKKSGRQAVHQMIDLPASMTKAEMLAEIQQMVQDWIEEHYGSDPEGRSSIRITIQSLKGL